MLSLCTVCFRGGTERDVADVVALRQTASMHVFRTPPSSSYASLVCTEEYTPVRLWLGEKKITEHIQYGYARLNQRTLLHVEKSIPEQVTFGL